MVSKLSVWFTVVENITGLRADDLKYINNNFTTILKGVTV